MGEAILRKGAKTQIYIPETKPFPIALFGTLRVANSTVGAGLFQRFLQINERPVGEARFGEEPGHGVVVLGAFFGAGKDGKHLVEVPVKGVSTPANLNQVKQVETMQTTSGTTGSSGATPH